MFTIILIKKKKKKKKKTNDTGTAVVEAERDRVFYDRSCSFQRKNALFLVVLKVSSLQLQVLVLEKSIPCLTQSQSLLLFVRVRREGVQLAINSCAL